MTTSIRTRDDRYPSRIVCLTEETTETLYLLEEDWRIVGISGFTVRPPRARREKPKVSAFTSAKVDRIRDLQPDLVLGFSDLQADIAAQLARLGLNVFIFNQRDVAGILQMIRVLGGMIGCGRRPTHWRRGSHDSSMRFAPALPALRGARACISRSGTSR
jgi:iron complex transport system substrate-binding protein